MRRAGIQGYLRNVPAFPSGGGFEACPVSVSGDVRIPRFNTALNHIRSEWLTPLLPELVTLVARPLRGVEHEFAAGGTSWSAQRREKRLDHRLAFELARLLWVKFHLVVGVKTNVIARAAVSPGENHDRPYFRGLMVKTAKRFDAHTVLADMGDNLGLRSGFPSSPAHIHPPMIIRSAP